MKYFIDWARTKKISYVDENGKAYEVTPQKLFFKEGDTVFVETGFLCVALAVLELAI